MHILALLIVCVGFWLLFPKGFKYLVGTWVGFCAGGFFWGLSVLAFHGLVTVGAFVAFIVGGIVAGWILAAKG